MKKTTYLQRINESADATAKKNNALCAKEAKLNLQTEMLNAERDKAKYERELELALKAVPFSPQACYNIQTSIDLVTRKFNHYENMLNQLF